MEVEIELIESIELRRREPTPREALGLQIAQVRRICGMTQRELADHLGVKTHTVKGLEGGRGSSNGTKMEVIEKIATLADGRVVTRYIYRPGTNIGAIYASGEPITLWIPNRLLRMPV